MDLPSRPQCQTGFRSRRSYPSLNQVSLAPLTRQYPIDDDEQGPEPSPQDYFSRNEALDTPTRTSYLSSYSVPGTPGVLSRTPSRSGSRPRYHTRSKSSTPIHLSDTNIQEKNANQPLHHQSRASTGSGGRMKRSAVMHQQTPGPQDPEWMLRAGIALASSTREEKGQSWLAKRESSTSLISEGRNYEGDANSQSLRSGMSKRSKSGRSTPAAAASRSRTASRRNSKHDLAMTGLERTTPLPSASNRNSVHTASAPRTPHNEYEARSSGSLPDFIDEQVRAEMRDTIQQIEPEYDSASSRNWDSSSDDYEEIDERELQRLTRERGFGLGSWVDRMVEWTLFSVDDWPLTTDPVNNPPLPQQAEDISHLNHGDSDTHSPPELSDNDNEDTKSITTGSDTNSEIFAAERAGDRGGWEDAGWFFRAIRRALIST